MTFEEYTRHIRLVPHRRPAADTPGSTNRAGARRHLSAARSEEAIDGPLRMARCPLAGKAVAGIVDAVDREHREVVTTAVAGIVTGGDREHREVVTTNRARRPAAGRAIARSFWGDGGATVR